MPSLIPSVAAVFHELSPSGGGCYPSGCLPRKHTITPTTHRSVVVQFEHLNYGAGEDFSRPLEMTENGGTVISNGVRDLSLTDPLPTAHVGKRESGLILKNSSIAMVDGTRLVCLLRFKEADKAPTELPRIQRSLRDEARSRVVEHVSEAVPPTFIAIVQTLSRQCDFSK
jgi:hypothetical protein